MCDRKITISICLIAIQISIPSCVYFGVKFALHCVDPTIAMETVTK